MRTSEGARRVGGEWASPDVLYVCWLQCWRGSGSKFHRQGCAGSRGTSLLRQVAKAVHDWQVAFESWSRTTATQRCGLGMHVSAPPGTLIANCSGDCLEFVGRRPDHLARTRCCRHNEKYFCSYIELHFGEVGGHILAA